MSSSPAPAPEERRRIVSDSTAVAVATGAYGISFGAIGISSGLDVWQTCALSLLVFTGASQFAFAGVIASGGAPLLGLRGNVLKAHGSSNRHAIRSAIRAANVIIKADLNHRIEADVQRANAVLEQTPVA